MTIHAQASKLDMDKFAKVHRLMSQGATEGERHAARTRAEAMAVRAGMTLKQAVSKMDSKPKSQAFAAQPSSDWRDIFRGFDDWCEDREPGYKARKAKDAEIAAARRKIDIAGILARYGSEDAVFAETEREASLREALASLADYAELHAGGGSYIKGYAGWTVGEPTARLWEALRGAFPFPTTLAAVWEEYCDWLQLDDDRATMDEHWDTPRHIRARKDGLEHLLDTMSDPTVEGVRTRLRWLSRVSIMEVTRGIKEDRNLADCLSLDFAALSRQFEKAAQNGQGNNKSEGSHTAAAAERGVDKSHLRRTNADKQRDVLSMLDTDPEMTDRAIARRCGVSPQTVSNWRKRRAAA